MICNSGSHILRMRRSSLWGYMAKVINIPLQHTNVLFCDFQYRVVLHYNLHSCLFIINTILQLVFYYSNSLSILYYNVNIVEAILLLSVYVFKIQITSTQYPLQLKEWCSPSTVFGCLVALLNMEHLVNR